MVRCAYCGAEGKMSREHVIPKGFINNMDFKALTVWLDKAPSKVINSELMVKDVCAECNTNIPIQRKQEIPCPLTDGLFAIHSPQFAVILKHISPHMIVPLAILPIPMLK